MDIATLPAATCVDGLVLEVARDLGLRILCRFTRVTQPVVDTDLRPVTIQSCRSLRSEALQDEYQLIWH